MHFKPMDNFNDFCGTTHKLKIEHHLGVEKIQNSFPKFSKVHKQVLNSSLFKIFPEIT